MTSFAPSPTRTVTALDLGLGSLRDRVAADPGTGADARAGTVRPRGRLRLRGVMAALGDRLPLWVRVRCGIAPRTLAALTAVLVAAVALGAYHFWAGRPRTVRVPAREGPVAASPPEAVVPPAPGSGPGPSAPGSGPVPSARSLVVDVAGKVRRPGVQRLPPGSRVEDALEAAGGARPGVDTAGLNRARVLMDGELIVVGAGPAPGGPAQGGPVLGGPAPVGPASASGGGAGPAGAGPVSLNSATLEQLDALPGVGPVLAQHILDYRTQHGGFRSVSDLRHVNGIGARRFTDLKPLVQP
ncbi:helix-hairpin-helix domain-containing protein [Streptomyces abikoensis]|uniref:helix-hairpin-helix domain-containing protein n=1 Tax=Streptomyces abikoensis TaxID=97398 RepID=UPI0036C8F1F1